MYRNVRKIARFVSTLLLFALASPAQLAFALNPIGTVGNAGIDIVRGPALSNLDLAMFKNFQLKERFKLQVRAEFFNTLNHTVLGNPNTTFTNGNFGKILGTQTAPRVGEMGLKLLF